MIEDWPEIDFPAWRDTAQALHLQLQIVGKYKLARSPWVNHSWHATFLVTPRGWTTASIPDGSSLEFEFDVVDGALQGRAGDGRTGQIALKPTSIADFHRAFVNLVAKLGGNPAFHGVPNEMVDPVPFAQDTAPRPFDLDSVRRFHRASASTARVFQAFRTGFLGKASPVHVFWGSFDLAVTRFSGRPAPLHKGGIPSLPDAVAQEAYDREVSSAGFWPGGGGIDEAAFYSYAYPAPAGFGDATVRPPAAFWHRDLGEFVLPYEAVRTALDPDAALLAFLTSTYEAAAELGGWDRAALECDIGMPGRPRPVGQAAARGVLPFIEREEGPSKGRYITYIGGAEAELTYSRLGSTSLIIDHTGVPDALRGQGVGQALVLRAVQDARRENRSILPLCPFAKSQFARHPEWADVLRR